MDHQLESKHLLFLPALTNLEHLVIGRSGIIDGGISGITLLTNLTALRIETGKLDEFGFMTKLTNIQKLHVGDVVTWQGADWIFSLPKLKHLSLDITTNECSSLHLLEHMHLESLSLRCKKWDFADVATIVSTFTTLSHLQLAVAAPNEINIQKLLPLTQLKSLSLSRPLPIDWVRHLTSLTNLTTLDARSKREEVEVYQQLFPRVSNFVQEPPSYSFK